MVRADDDEGVAEDVVKYLEDHPAEMDQEGRPPRVVVLTYQTTAGGYIGAVIVLCIIFTLSLFMALFLFRAGKILTLWKSVTNWPLFSVSGYLEVTEATEAAGTAQD